MQVPNPLRPPLRALAAFEAAARLGSFNAAAGELRLTPSAVSHQIVGLERLLGVELFARVGRGVELTPLGGRYFESMQRILLALDETTREVVSLGALDVVTIHTPPSLASKWLLPLLRDFMHSHPHVEVRVSAETGRAGFSWETVDLAILYREPRDGESHVTPLLEESIQPMCSPTTLRRRPIEHLADVLHHPLIHSNHNAITWRDWFGAQGLSRYRQHQRIQIDPSHVAIEAAVKDFGVVLESDVLARQELSSGQLITPLSQYAIRRMSYALTWSPDRKLSQSASVFRDWLVASSGKRE
jgi:LysR family transcriptional regulator, glycine cleavage system transcriptional activator